MKNRRIYQLLSIVLSLILAAAAPAALIADEAPSITFVAEACSPWAELDVFMAGTAYGLGDGSTYSDYRGDLTAEKFRPVYNDLAGAFGVYGNFGPEHDPLTRGEVIARLYEIIREASSAPEGDAVSFFIEEGLVGGRSSGNYDLDQTCTVEEMIVLSARVYDYLSYQAGRDSKGFFWEVQGGVNKVYLLGSIHFNDGSMYPLSRAIEKAYANSACLAVEADIFDLSAADQAYALFKGMYTPESGETIQDYLPPETYELYAATFDALAFPPEAYNLMKPWFANILLQGLTMTADDSEALLGVDMYFLRKAHAAEKNIIELESLVFQYDLFDSFSDELQLLQLNQTLALIASASQPEAEDVDDEGRAEAENALREMYSQLLEIVRSGDEESLELILGIGTVPDDPLDVEYYDKLITDRNLGMADQIVGFLSGEGTAGDYFVVVGAAHMLGDGGIVALLTDMGYRVERIK